MIQKRKNPNAFLFPIIQHDTLRGKYQTHKIRKSHLYLNMENASSSAMEKTDDSMKKTCLLQNS